MGQDSANSYSVAALNHHSRGYGRINRDDFQDMLKQAATMARIDFSPSHRPPAALRVLFATLASIFGSLVADAVLVTIAQVIFPSTRGYTHFQFSDYAKLTVIGVVIAGVAWPIISLLSFTPKWLYFRLGILVTVVLWLPDIYILDKGQPAGAVGVLMIMHVAIAVVTYNLLVKAAPIRCRHHER